MDYVSFPSIETEPPKDRMESPQISIKCTKCADALEKVTVEPALFLLALAYGLNTPTHQAVVYRKACLNLYHNHTICDNLYTNESSVYLDETQKLTSQWEFYSTVVFTPPALLAVALYGSWSDRLSRKLPLLLAPVGSILNTLCFLLNAIFMEASLSYLLIGQFLDGLTGGYACFLMAAFSYLSAMSSAEGRTHRISVVYASQTVASAVSALSSGVLLDSTGYLTVYGVVLVLLFAMVMYIVFCVKEVGTDAVPMLYVSEETMGYSSFQEESTFRTMRIKDKLKALFSLSHMKESFVVTFKWRPNKQRHYIIVLITIALGIQVTYAISIQYLFFRHPPLSWSQSLYGYYKGYNALVHFTSQALWLPFLKVRLHLTDQLLLIIGIISEMLGRIWTGFCRATWMVFLSSIINYMMTFNFTCIRSMLSQLVKPDEFGKMFAVVAWLETLGALAATLLYNGLLYPVAVPVFPGLVFLVSGVLLAPVLGLAGWLYSKQSTMQPPSTANVSQGSATAAAQQANNVLEQMHEIDSLEDTSPKDDIIII